MGRKTSVYVPDDLDEAVRAAGVPMTELLRRGLGRAGADEATARLAAQEAAQAIAADVREIVRAEIRSALGEMSGGGY